MGIFDDVLKGFGSPGESNIMDTISEKMGLKALIEHNNKYADRELPGKLCVKGCSCDDIYCDDCLKLQEEPYSLLEELKAAEISGEDAADLAAEAYKAYSVFSVQHMKNTEICNAEAMKNLPSVTKVFAEKIKSAMNTMMSTPMTKDELLHMKNLYSTSYSNYLEGIISGQMKIYSVWKLEEDQRIRQEQQRRYNERNAEIERERQRKLAKIKEDDRRRQAIMDDLQQARHNNKMKSYADDAYKRDLEDASKYSRSSYEYKDRIERAGDKLADEYAKYNSTNSSSNSSSTYSGYSGSSYNYNGNSGNLGSSGTYNPQTSASSGLDSITQLGELFKQLTKSQDKQSNEKQPQSKDGRNLWDCECGNKGNAMNFCPSCGKEKPAAKVWHCNRCGADITNLSNAPKFCTKCGSPFDGGGES